MGPIPTWRIVGTIQDVRELGTTKDKTKIWALAIKICAMGGTYEVSTRDLSLKDQLPIGLEATFAGSFSNYNGTLRLDLDGFKTLETHAPTKPATAPTAAR